MRTLSNAPRLSNTVTFSLSTSLRTYIMDYLAHRNAQALNDPEHLHPLNTSEFLRTALRYFLDNPHLHKMPTDLRPLLTDTNRLAVTRDAMLATNINSRTHKHDRSGRAKPNPDHDLRDRLDIYCKSHNLQASTALRRAVQQYIRDHNPDQHIDPIAVVDAWGDR